jgi:hypothetical protein
MAPQPTTATPDETFTLNHAAPPAPRVVTQERARTLDLPARFGPKIVVLPEDVAELTKTPAGQRILASAYTTDTNFALVPADNSSHGFTGLNVQMGRVMQEQNREMGDMRSRMMKFREMRVSDTAWASTETVLCYPVAMTEYSIIPGDDKELADKLEWNIHEGLEHPVNDIPGRPFSDVVYEATLARLYGWAWHYQKKGPMDMGSGGTFTGWQELAPRLQALWYQWDFDDEGHVIGLVAYGTNPRTMESEYVYYRRDEIILWTWDSEGGDPEGLGALRRSLRAYTYKDEFQNFAAIKIERQACPIPIAYAPEGVDVTKEDLEPVMAAMRNIRTGESGAAYVPGGWRIEPFSLGDSSVPFETHIERQHQAEMQTTGTQMIGFGQGGNPGSNAMIVGSSDWLSDVILEGLADWVCRRFNTDAIPDFARANGSTAKNLPKLAHGKVAVRNPEKWMRALAQRHKDGTPLTAEEHAAADDVLGIVRKADTGAPPVKPVAKQPVLPLDEQSQQ